MQNCVITITQDNLVQSFAESTSLKTVYEYNKGTANTQYLEISL